MDRRWRERKNLMSTIDKWMNAASKEQQLGIVVPVMMIKVWYAAGEHPDAVERAFRQQGIGAAEIELGTVSYLHMVAGSYPAFPEAVRNFLAESPTLVVPVLRMFYQGRIERMKEIDHGRLTSASVDSAVSALLLMQLVSIADQQAGLSMLSDFIANRLPHTVIDEDVESTVAELLASGQYPGGHPAHDFLRRVVELAPATRGLPGRVKTLTAFLYP